MKWLTTLGLALFTATGLAFTSKPSSLPALKTERAKVSYSLGADMGTAFQKREIEINPDIFSQGFRDGLQGKLRLSSEQMVTILKAYQNKLLARQRTALQALRKRNAKAGAAFLAKNQAKPGVITTASGLQYKVIQAGQGDPPKAEDTVTVRYQGHTLEGKTFEESKKPVSFKVGEVLSGWTEALKLMKPGSEFEVVLPPQLAYGEHGMAPVIGPNQTLQFNIHLLKVEPAVKR